MMKTARGCVRELATAAVYLYSRKQWQWQWQWQWERVRVPREGSVQLDQEKVSR